MNHGGPYPATGHPGFTAVGIPASLRRFAMLRCYDNVRPHRLPAGSRTRTRRADVAVHRRQLDAGGRSRVTAAYVDARRAAEIPIVSWAPASCSRRRARRRRALGGAAAAHAEMLLEEPSGNLFRMTQDAGMGWDPAELARAQYLILSTKGGLRAEDGWPVALGFHTGHWEVGLLVSAAAAGTARLERASRLPPTSPIPATGVRRGRRR